VFSEAANPGDDKICSGLRVLSRGRSDGSKEKRGEGGPKKPVDFERIGADKRRVGVPSERGRLLEPRFTARLTQKGERLKGVETNTNKDVVRLTKAVDS